MQLPNRAKAFVQSGKLTSYLLSETHIVGGAKAKFFRALGFNESNLDVLEAELLKIAKTLPVKEIKETIYGPKHVIIGSIATPTGRSVNILTVWIIDKGKSNPRFVTARPYKKRDVEDTNCD